MCDNKRRRGEEGVGLEIKYELGCGKMEEEDSTPDDYIDPSPFHKTLEGLYQTSIRGLNVAKEFVELGSDVPAKIAEVGEMFDGTNLQVLLIELLMSENKRAERTWIKNHSTDAGTSEYDGKVQIYRDSLFRKRRVANMIIEIICNERWHGSTSLNPTINSVTFLGSSGGISKSLGRLLSSLRVSNSVEMGRQMRLHVATQCEAQFASDMVVKDQTPLVVMYDNWQKGKAVALSKVVGGDSKFLSFIVGYYIEAQESNVELSTIGQVNYCFNLNDCETILGRSRDSPEMIDTVMFELLDQLPVANSSVSILHTSNFPPIEANSGSEQDINDHVINETLIGRMKAGDRILLSGSDPEPSWLHQKLTNKRLSINRDDPIKKILNFPGRMHIEMHILNSMCSFQPHLILVVSFFLVQIWGYKPDLLESSLMREIGKMKDEITTNATRYPGSLPGWTDELRDELSEIESISIESLEVLHRFLKVWVSIPPERRKMAGIRRSYLNLPEFSKMRIYLRALLEGWNDLPHELKSKNSCLSDFFHELEFFLIPIKDAQCGKSSTFFSRFGTMVALFKASNRPKLVNV